MQAIVINIRVSYFRGGYDNFGDWISDPDNIYIGKAINGYAETSEWYCPFKYSKERYRKYLKEMLKDEDTLARFRLLRGKTLGCWCKPGNCHGDVIASILNNM